MASGSPGASFGLLGAGRAFPDRGLSEPPGPRLSAGSCPPGVREVGGLWALGVSPLWVAASEGPRWGGWAGPCTPWAPFASVPGLSGASREGGLEAGEGPESGGL